MDLTRVSQLLGLAKSEGINPEQMYLLKQRLRQEGWHPTKKQPTLAKRRRKRKLEKIARRKQRGKR